MYNVDVWCEPINAHKSGNSWVIVNSHVAADADVSWIRRAMMLFTLDHVIVLFYLIQNFLSLFRPFVV